MNDTMSKSILLTLNGRVPGCVSHKGVWAHFRLFVLF
ncbi:hypothetical protein ES332_D07G101400v1 [Gossypium tomentosum]|uniref:Uncharacterized protein n=1 Tax=Gossypium tomentosum TaxID=34277 RepID=A0A5D2K5Z3_GOSTO|nr:hypothetical protein ES332_D07G101400v1 [Gossypium tomentosum]